MNLHGLDPDFLNKKDNYEEYHDGLNRPSYNNTEWYLDRLESCLAGQALVSACYWLGRVYGSQKVTS